MSSRPSWNQHYIAMARDIAQMGTCHRRQVGCVLVDAHNVILATGFNGTPPEWPHCRYPEIPTDVCPGAHLPSGTGLDTCMANHAEINALIKCGDVSRIRTVYTTTSPCISCVKAILCTGASRIVFSEEYPHQESKYLWLRHALIDRSIVSQPMYTPRQWIYVDSEGRESVSVK